MCPQATPAPAGCQAPDHNILWSCLLSRLYPVPTATYAADDRMSLTVNSAAVPPEFRDFPTAFPQGFAQRFCADFPRKSGSSPHALHAFFTRFSTPAWRPVFSRIPTMKLADAAAEKGRKASGSGVPAEKRKEGRTAPRNGVGGPSAHKMWHVEQFSSCQ